MSRINYGIRYPEGEDDEEYNPKNNYGSWKPKTTRLTDWNIRGRHHEFIPADYVMGN